MTLQSEDCSVAKTSIVITSQRVKSLPTLAADQATTHSLWLNASVLKEESTPLTQMRKLSEQWRKKAAKRGLHNIEAYASSASNLGFIKDGSVDFILANGLLCSMVPQYHKSAVNEIRRVLKPSGQAYLSVAGGFYSYVDQAEWEKILEAFRVEQRGNPFFADRWALVSTKQR
jgi:SAM-dependent methyltransferase